MRSLTKHGPGTIHGRARAPGGSPVLWRVIAAGLSLALFLPGWQACSAGGQEAGEGSDDAGLTGNDGLGRIEGRVTIGPICPVERIPPDPRCSPTPEMFARVKVHVLSEAGELLRVVDLDAAGGYAVELGAGAYLVDTNYRGPGLPGPLDVAPEGPGVSEGDDGGSYRILPVAVEVRAGQSVKVDIDIDTGIR